MDEGGTGASGAAAWAVDSRDEEVEKHLYRQRCKYEALGVLGAEAVQHACIARHSLKIGVS